MKLDQCITMTKLNYESIIEVAEGRSLLVRIPLFYPADISREVSQRIIGDPYQGADYALEGYQNIKEILTDGRAFYDSATPERREAYYRNGPCWTETLRNVAAPYQAPFDKLRLMMDEVWPEGASLLTLGGRKHWVGMTRVFRDAAEALPHQDIIGQDAPNYPEAHQFITQLAANIYLRPAVQGGQLELWDWRPTVSDFATMGIPGSYGFDRTRIPAADFTIAPQMGDLFLFDSTKLHAVLPAYEGARVTASGFIGYRGRRKPLSVWS